MEASKASVPQVRGTYGRGGERRRRGGVEGHCEERQMGANAKDSKVARESGMAKAMGITATSTIITS